MASNTSKTARASVRAGQAGQAGALSVLGEFKYLIPLNQGKHAYVRNLVNGKTAHVRTDSEAFVEEIRMLAGAGHAAKIRAEINALAAESPGHGWDAHREAPRRGGRLRGLSGFHLRLRPPRISVAGRCRLRRRCRFDRRGGAYRGGAARLCHGGPRPASVQDLDPPGVEVVDRRPPRRPPRRRLRHGHSSARSRRTVAPDVAAHRAGVHRPGGPGRCRGPPGRSRRPGSPARRPAAARCAARPPSPPSRRTARGRAPPPAARRSCRHHELDRAEHGAVEHVTRRSAPRRWSRTSGRRSPPAGPGSPCTPPPRRPAAARRGDRRGRGDVVAVPRLAVDETLVAGEQAEQDGGRRAGGRLCGRWPGSSREDRPDLRSWQVIPERR